MMSSAERERQRDHWEQAGEIGYGNAMYSCPAVERHIVSAHWNAMIDMASTLGVSADAKVLDLGCGDGEFSRLALAPRFREVDAYDYSSSAIERARAGSGAVHVRYHVADLRVHSFSPGEHWDAAFLKGFLHHVKEDAATIIDRLSTVCPTVVLLEPNGDNLIRKLLELSPAYKQAGEDSFRLKDLLGLFHGHGYRVRKTVRLTFVPPFLPAGLLPFVKSLERFVETVPPVNRLCSTYVLGFTKGGT